MTEPAKPIALIAEDDPITIMVLEELFKEKYNVMLKKTAEEVVEVAAQLKTENKSPDFFLTDKGLEGAMEGLEAIDKVREIFPNVPTVMLSGSRDYEELQEAVDAKQGVFIRKPAGKEALEQAIADAKIKISSAAEDARKNQKQIFL